MTLETLQKDMISSMRKGDKVRKEVLSGAISAVKKTAIDKKTRDNISEELINEVLLKEQKTLEEMVETCPSDRVDTLKEYKEKLSIIKEYAPQLIADEKEIEKIIYDICDKHKICPCPEHKREFMKIVMPALKGEVDMKIANKVIQTILKPVSSTKYN